MKIQVYMTFTPHGENSDFHDIFTTRGENSYFLDIFHHTIYTTCGENSDFQYKIYTTWWKLTDI